MSYKQCNLQYRINRALIALKFDMTPLAIAVVACASYVGSGLQFKNGAWVIAGIGDLINTMITATIAVLFILLIENVLVAWH